NIAYWQVGHVPVRAPGDDPFLVHPGTGGGEGGGFPPPPPLPPVSNPGPGRLANWEKQPQPGRRHPPHRGNDRGPGDAGPAPGPASSYPCVRTPRPRPPSTTSTGSPPRQPKAPSATNSTLPCTRSCPVCSPR